MDRYLSRLLIELVCARVRNRSDNRKQYRRDRNYYVTQSANFVLAVILHRSIRSSSIIEHR